ncbi:MAG: hypothetical protein IIB77_11690 [Proteobacteria bacterium]|nr:hypothetical protein [Pseudomonadota bacterium]
MDNWYTTVANASALLEKEIYMIGTARSNRISLNPDVKNRQATCPPEGLPLRSHRGPLPAGVSNTPHHISTKYQRCMIQKIAHPARRRGKCTP